MKLLISPLTLHKLGILQEVINTLDIGDGVTDINLIMLRDFVNGELPPKYQHFCPNHAMPPLAISLTEDDVLLSLRSWLARNTK
jgi:hypothetical protein